MLLMTRRVLMAALAAAAVLSLGFPRPLLAAQDAPLPAALQNTEQSQQTADDHAIHPLHEIGDAMVRLPLAAALGAALALRPKRRGTPPRTPAVVQTQIVLSLVGAIVMLVVGASLARAFGIVGAANLVRYRSKIDDPKDAAVMLCALSVGLASGVGLYALTIFSTVFMVAALWVIDSYKLPFELRSASDEEVCYEIQVPMEVHTDDVSNRILTLDPEGHLAVEWEEKKAKK